MSIPSQYQSYVDQAVKQLENNEPFFCFGMCESGKNFTFRYVVEAVKKEPRLSNVTLVLNVSGGAEPGRIAILNLHDNSTVEIPLANLNEIISSSQVDSSKVLLINLGEHDEINVEILRTILQLRALHGGRLEYGVFGYVDVYNLIKSRRELQELLTRRMIMLLPSLDEELQEVIRFNEMNHGVTLSHTQREQLALQSGGNPGLIKTLILQVKNNPEWSSADLADPALIARLNRLVSGLSDLQLKELTDIAGRKMLAPKLQHPELGLFGYVRRGDAGNFRVFSPLIESSLTKVNAVDDDIFKLLTPMEAHLYALLVSSRGTIITRDQIADRIWGDSAAEKYSDYTIDKHLSNIRKKTKSTRFDLDIRTIKGRGVLVS